MASPDVKSHLIQHPSLEFDQKRQKIKCNLTNHEMPATVKAVESYVSGKKYKKASEMDAFNLDEHKIHIVPSTKKKHLHEMFCTLTLRHIEKTPQAIQRHISGRKYKNSLARWTKCQETGEKFVPHVRRKSKLPRSYKADSGDSPFHNEDDDRQDDSDNMSDLYPDEDLDDDDEVDEEDDDESVEDCDDDESVEDCDDDESVEDCDDDESVNEEDDDDEEIEEAVQIRNRQSEMEQMSDSYLEDSDSDSDYDMTVLKTSSSHRTADSREKIRAQKSHKESEVNGLSNGVSPSAPKPNKKRKLEEKAKSQPVVTPKEKKKAKKRKQT